MRFESYPGNSCSSLLVRVDYSIDCLEMFIILPAETYKAVTCMKLN